MSVFESYKIPSQSLTLLLKCLVDAFDLFFCSWTSEFKISGCSTWMSIRTIAELNLWKVLSCGELHGARAFWWRCMSCGRHELPSGLDRGLSKSTQKRWHWIHRTVWYDELHCTGLFRPLLVVEYRGPQFHDASLASCASSATYSLSASPVWCCWS